LNKNELNETCEENHRLFKELKDANSEIERIHSTLNQEELKKINRCSQIPGSPLPDGWQAGFRVRSIAAVQGFWVHQPLNSEPVNAYQNNERVIGVWKI